MKFVSTKHACIFPMLQIGVAGIKKSIDYLEPKLYQIRSLYLYIRCPGHSLWLNKQKEKKRKLKSSLLLKELCFSVERRFFSLFLCGCSCTDNPLYDLLYSLRGFPQSRSFETHHQSQFVVYLFV